MFKGFKSTHSDRLERFLGPDKVRQLSKDMAGWYGPPIALAGVPGTVFATGDGDFIGNLRDGFEATYLDYARDLTKRIKRAARIATGNKRNRLDAGFASLSDLISEATAGAKRQNVNFFKTGPTGVAGAASTDWFVGVQPAAGSAGLAAPGGRICTRATTGAMVGWANPTGGDTLHLVSSSMNCSVVNSVLLYDRLFDVNKTMNSTASESVTGAPTRYQNTTIGAPDSAAGNFLSIEIQTVLPATAHNWTPCTYADQDGVSSTLPSVTGLSAGIAGRIDTAAATWFCPLETGDSGIQQLDSMQCSAAVATGAITFMIGHPLAWLVCPVANLMMQFDHINTAFNLVRIFDDACLALIETSKPATTTCSINGSLTLVAG